jgi:hypothetical protein
MLKQNAIAPENSLHEESTTIDAFSEAFKVILGKARDPFYRTELGGVQIPESGDFFHDLNNNRKVDAITRAIEQLLKDPKVKRTERVGSSHWARKTPNNHIVILGFPWALRP